MTSVDDELLTTTNLLLLTAWLIRFKSFGFQFDPILRLCFSNCCPLNQQKMINWYNGRFGNARKFVQPSFLVVKTVRFAFYSVRQCSGSHLQFCETRLNEA